MKTQSNRLNSIVAATLMTLTLTACGSGSLPSELTTSSTAASTTPATVLDVTGYATPTSIKVGESSTIVASEGSGVYTYLPSSASFGTLNVNVFTGTAIGDTTITIRDSNGKTFPVTISVVAATPLPTVAPTTKLLYRYNVFTVFGEQKRLYIDSSVTPAGYQFENTTFKVLVDGTVASTKALRQCTDLTSVQSVFQSSDANCEGQTVGAILGYVYSAPAANLLAVRRYSKNYSSVYLGGMTDRLLIIGEVPGPDGYGLDGIIGYVPQ